MAGFQKWLRQFDEDQVRIIAGSVDPLDKAKEALEKANITYPVAYGLDAIEISKLTGAYYDYDKKYLHPTAFLLRPDNTIDVVCYSSGPLGRFNAKEVLGLVKFYKKQKANETL